MSSGLTIRIPGARGTAAPLVGKHTEAVLADFGFSESSVTRFIELGAIFQAQAEPNESTHTQEK